MSGAGPYSAPAHPVPLHRMWERVDLARSEGDIAVFFDLMYLGELLFKLIVAGTLAAIGDDSQRTRYRLEHSLVRANGIGQWADALDEALAGTAAQHLLPAAAEDRREFTQIWPSGDSSWQRNAVDRLTTACRAFGEYSYAGSGRTSLRLWFRDFVWLRNRTRGHGALPSRQCAAIVEPLQESLLTICDSLHLFRRPWMVLHRNLSGKYRVIRVAGNVSAFDHLKSQRDHHYHDGLYVAFDTDLCLVPLISTDVDLSDFYVANGAFRETSASAPAATYEGLSYITDTQRQMDGAHYLTPPGPLPESETHGRPILDIQGKTFTNVPPVPTDYVGRPHVEAELQELLLDDRHPIVTLVGRGGIGKTSLALRVLRALAESGEFFSILWFSARDIDLLPQGPKLVRAAVRSQDEVAKVLLGLLDPSPASMAGLAPVEYLAGMLDGRLGIGRLLFVFDNFETVASPGDFYRFLDGSIRLPNKVLLTTRFREFKADYPLDVRGMERAEFDALAEGAATRLGLSNLTASYKSEVYDESDGHPYIVKAVLAECARTGRRVSLDRFIKGSDEILDALFQRSYNALTPAGQRAFLTLCNWRSTIPRLVLEATLLRPGNERMDVRDAIDALERSSLVELLTSTEDETEYIRTPLAAFAFGSRRLRTSPMKIAVEADTAFLRTFGAMRPTAVTRGLAPRIARMVRALAPRLQEGDRSGDELAIIEFLASRYPRAWVELAAVQADAESESVRSQAISSFERYLEVQPDDHEAWRRFADLCRRLGDDSRELNARFELARLPGADYVAIVSAAASLNHHLARGSVGLEADEGRLMSERLLEMLEARRPEARASDLAQMAWLHLRLNQVSEAKDAVMDGLRLDPDNIHCLRIASGFER